MSIPERAATELMPSEVGIGRPIAEESLEAVIEAFRIVMPGELRFMPREIPGVNYVSADRLKALVENSSAQIDQSHIPQLANQIVASLCAKGRLDTDTVLASRPTFIDSFSYKMIDGFHVHLRARLKDYPTSFYPDGYLFDGEKTAAMEALHLTREPSGRSSNKPPRGVLRLGIIAGRADVITIPKLQRLKNELGSEVSLSGVGVITSQ